MADINEARQQMMEELQRKIQTDSKLSSIRSKIQNGDYSEASQYGMRSGEILSEVIRGNITEELFQQCDVKGLGEMLLPVIKQENQYVSNAVTAAQKAQNVEAGIGIKPLQAERDLNSYFNIFTKMKSDAYESFEQASWLLDEPIVHDSLSIVDDTLKENADFQYKSGLRTCVIRDAEPDCCDWCAERAGTYYYPDVPDSVWERHNNCLCEIRIETEKDENSKRIDIGRDNRIANSKDDAEKWSEKQGIRKQNLIAKATIDEKDYFETKKNYRELWRYQEELFERGRILYNDKEDELIANNASMVTPIEEFTDFALHGHPDSVDYTSNIGIFTQFTAKEFADILRLDPAYKGGNVRLLCCSTGKEDTGFAYQLSKELGVKVKAPTELLWINSNGDMYISDNEVLAHLWKKGYDVIQTGRWRTFPEEDD